MLTIRYEQSLVETAVFLAVRNDERLECELHQATDRLYEIPDEELRHREFVPVFREFFAKLELDRVISNLLAERPLIGSRVNECIVREAAKRKAESAELLVRRDIRVSASSDRTLVIQICPQSFLESNRFTALMRRELLHVADMLDERFDYVREPFPGDPARQSLQRDRYRVLWDIYVEGRLRREGLGIGAELDRLRQGFDRVFGDASTEMNHAVVERLMQSRSLTHRNFMEWARDPPVLFDSRPEPNDAATHTACA